MTTSQVGKEVLAPALRCATPIANEIEYILQSAERCSRRAVNLRNLGNQRRAGASPPSLPERPQRLLFPPESVPLAGPCTVL